MSAEALRVYLDVCCLNRPFDDQSQARVRLEAEAVLAVLAHADAGEVTWVGADPLALEMGHTHDQARRERVEALLQGVSDWLIIDTVAVLRAKRLEGLGFHPFDALHLACAEGVKAAVFLTTDDRLANRARRHSMELHVRVVNPLDWIREWQPG